ncbi:hypothetical protein [Runella salmonicolor]|uniref:Tryptophan-rich sensory protein n=1 Tax=Runella salmonicolor TaxID=2950278 RepID=A0ABT1FP74_9BACT|nr:hypothetical protein [Runella salmonicolor]MCP1383573.1 hypothetical protein [Runella salmonicolor]
MTTLWNKSAVKTYQILNWVFFLAMVFVNYLANALPINDKTTGQLSNQYPNLFVPAPVTFSIWGVIYLLLLVFCIKQSKSLFSAQVDPATAETVTVIGPRFIITCILNMVWILVWHYEYVAFSVFIMVLFLGQLININARIDSLTPYLAKNSRFSVKAPFGLYLGWLCIATVANATTLLVILDWNGWGQSEVFWASAMVLVGAIIGSFALLKLRNAYIGISVIWALIGVIIARLDADVYHRFVVWSSVFGIIVVSAAVIAEITGSLFRTKKVKIVETTQTIISSN